MTERDTFTHRAVDAAGSLDLLLTDAALGPVRRMLPGMAGVRFAAGLAGRPRGLAVRGTDLLREYAHIAAGRSVLAPAKGDRRFADPAWMGNPMLRRLVQAYLASARTAEDLVTDADLRWRDEERIRFVLTNLIDALSPSNNPVVSPVAWKAAIDTGGVSAVRGVTNLVTDLASSPRVPSMVETSAFEVGRTLAVTPGAVVERAAMYELIQYAPQTERVAAVPLLIVPPMINKYYIIDLAPGRSLIEYLVGQGHQVFVMSWRNPDARHRGNGLDAYGQCVLDALDAVRRIRQVGQSHLLGLCSGGILASMVAAHLAEAGRLDTLATMNLGVTVLDQATAGLSAAAIDETAARAAIAASARRGYLDGRSLAEVFAWLRPNDLIWNYWVNNYLQGRKPPAFDVLYWNADTTRMAARLHRDFITLAVSNGLTKPGDSTLLGTPIDLFKVDVDSYIIAGVSDHICPWQSCYASTQLLGGKTRFVLSTAGHIASLVNPPDNPKSTFRTAGENPPDADVWLRNATAEKGSWWPDYSHWLAERSGPLITSPATLGNADYPPREPAPGTYVFDR
jgi:poly[(R)-3-hydroxyalkanoate] polymerase subunit PhaC